MLYEDEAGTYRVRPYPGYTWSAERRPGRYPAKYSTRGKVELLATYNPLTQEVIRHYGENKKTPEVVRLLERSLQVHSGYEWALVVMDNARTHHSQGLRDWMRDWNRAAATQHLPRIVPVYLPVQSPWLNSIEGVLGGLYRAVIVNNHFTSAQQMQEGIEAYFETRQQRYQHEVSKAEIAFWN